MLGLKNEIVDRLIEKYGLYLKSEVDSNLHEFKIEKAD